MKSSCWKKITRNWNLIYRLLIYQLVNWTAEQCREAVLVEYSRRERLEVVGIPSSVNIRNLEGKVCTVFNRIGVAVKPDDIEACHRLHNDKKTIAKFSKRKVWQQVLRVKKQLKNIDPSEFDFPENTVIFINESLCSYYKMLWDKCKELYSNVLYLKWEYSIQD